QLELNHGVPTPVEIEIWPSGTRFTAGEKLRGGVQGSDIYKYARWIVLARHPKTINAGVHVIHTGGKYDSHLLIPIIRRISARRSASINGRPPRGHDFQRQYQRKPARCQRTSVSGRMIVRNPRI